MSKSGCPNVELLVGEEVTPRGSVIDVHAWLPDGDKAGSAHALKVKGAYVMAGIAVRNVPRRCGLGTRMYEALAAMACKRGLPLRSDWARSPMADQFWRKQYVKGRAKCLKRTGENNRHCEQYELTDPCPTSLARLGDMSNNEGPSYIPWLLLGGGALLLLAARRKDMGLVFAAPLPGRLISSGWGRPRAYRNGTHFGIDIAAPIGTPLLSATTGTVIRRDNTDDSTAGKHVVVETRAAIGTVAVRYLHLDRIDVNLNTEVRRGQQLGTVGKSGTVSSNPHLHLDIFASDGVLAEYVKTFGRPTPDFPNKRSFGTQVPAEALIPAGGYTERTIAEAKKRNVSLRVA